MVHSNITQKDYNPDNSSVIYISNMRQSYLYLKHGGQVDLVDILYSDTKNDCLVFVFRKSDNIKKLFEMWNQHMLD